MSFILPDLPDPALRQPATLAALVPVFLSIYAQAVLAVLPNTFILKLSLLPFIVWQAWNGAVGLNFSMGLAKWLGFEDDEQFRSWNTLFAAAMFIMASRSFEWTFTKKPLRKYELPEGQDAPVERPLSVANVLLDALDLFFNHRGIGWSWSSHPFPRIPPPSIPSILVKTTVIFAVLDSSQYISHLMSPYIDKTGGGSPFDASPHSLPRTVSFLFATYVRAVWVYAQLELMYHVTMLIGRILLRQPASHWPPLFRQPWVATSVGAFWSVHWHQFFRHFVIVFGARPGGALLGRPGALIGAFAVSGLIHIVGLWGTGGSGMEMCHDAAFYLVMGVGVFLESVFERATGLPVRAQFGWLWTMAWALSWGSLLLDLRARCGIFAVEFLPDHLRPGKMLINNIIALFSKCK